MGLLITQASVAETWELRPELGLRYRESFETEKDESVLELKAGLNFFSEWQKWRFGLGLRASEAEPHSLSWVRLADGFGQKSLGLSQGFLNRAWELGELSSFEIFLGKFPLSSMASPLLWDPQRNPEGLLQQLAWGERFELRLYAGQFSLSPQAADIRFNQQRRRSWSFLAGFELGAQFGDFTRGSLSATGFWQHQPSSALADASVASGNRVQLEEDQASGFEENFAPIEVALSVASHPFGILTELRAAAALNLRSEQKDRGFYLEGKLGRPNTKSNFLFAAQLFSIESDLQIASLLDQELGGTNRRGFRVELSYFILDELSLWASFQRANRIRQNLLQNDRQEWILGCELKL
ncbi:MAG: hypothetical protein EA369_03770 [Bradymonadales bacterium]|nr:MAG: hypothetical protein EA369_03770 [Bradymonadales bacterium]